MMAATALPQGVQPVPWQVTERDAHANRWESITLITNEITAAVTAQKQSYIEVASGLNYFEEGQFHPTREEWQVTPQALAGQLHQRGHSQE